MLTATNLNLVVIF